MRLNLRISVFGLILGFFNTPSFAADPSDPVNRAETIVSALQFPLDQPVAFTQQQRNPLLRNIKKQSGTLSKSVHGLHMQVDAPRKEHRTINNGIVTLERQRRDRRTRSTKTVTHQTELKADQPAQLVLLTFEALLTGNTSLINQHYTLTALTTPRGWRITLTPTSQHIKEQIFQVTLLGCEENLQSFRYQSSEGNDSAHWMEVAIDPAVCAQPT